MDSFEKWQQFIISFWNYFDQSVELLQLDIVKFICEWISYVRTNHSLLISYHFAFSIWVRFIDVSKCLFIALKDSFMFAIDNSSSFFISVQMIRVSSLHIYRLNIIFRDIDILMKYKSQLRLYNFLW